MLDFHPFYYVILIGGFLGILVSIVGLSFSLSRFGFTAFSRNILLYYIALAYLYYDGIVLIAVSFGTVIVLTLVYKDIPE